MKDLFLQAIKFVGLSGIGWLFDFCTYTSLCILSQNLVVNNVISSWVGVTFVFVFSTKKVFKNGGKISLRLKYLIYLAYQSALIFFISKLLNSVHVWILSMFTWKLILMFSAIIAKMVVTPLTMVLNFFMMKVVIEKI